jgi:glycosyltransferase involved in cell wall biosynthesis
MRIAVVIATPEEGGVYQYSLNVLVALRHYVQSRAGVEVVVIASPHAHRLAAAYADSRWQWHTAPDRSILSRVTERLRTVARSSRRIDYDRIDYRSELTRWYTARDIDLVLYLSATPNAFRTRVPFVMAVHDLQHRFQPEFPEVSADGEWERREYLFRNAARHATLLLVDSDVGREDVLTCYGAYGVTAEKIKVLPFLPAPYLSENDRLAQSQRARAALQLPERYLFYPAQFWPHKNHGAIVRALAALHERDGLRIPVVLCGAHTGPLRERAFANLMRAARDANVSDLVRYVGFVPDELMAGCYAGAVALVMPTFFGPTNIPVLEAWACDCPVITSRIRGVREQVGDAGILVDPESTEELYGAIRRVWLEPGVRRELATAGRRRLAEYTREDFENRLAEIVDDARDRMRHVDV